LRALSNRAAYDKDRTIRAVSFLGQAIKRDPLYGSALALQRRNVITSLLRIVGQVRRCSTLGLARVRA